MRTADKLADPVILRDLGKWRSAGMSFGGMKKKLQTDHNISTGIISIKNALRTFTTRSQEVIAGDEETKEEIKGVVLNTKKQLKQINDMVWELIDESGADKSLKLKAMKEILEHLKFQEKILERMEEGIDFKKMNRVQMTTIIIENLNVLEDQGYIKILHTPGDIIDLEKLKEGDKEDETSEY